MKTFLLWFFEPKCANNPKPKNTPGSKMSKILQGAKMWQYKQVVYF